MVINAKKVKKKKSLTEVLLFFYCIKKLDERMLQLVESSFIFSIIWSMNILIPENKKMIFTNFFLKKIKSYRKSINFMYESPFGINFFTFFEMNEKNKFTVFEVTFDLQKEKWIFWSDFKLNTSDVIGYNLTDNQLNIFELIRLNPNILKLETIKSQYESEKEDHVVLPNSSLFYETDSSKITRFFLDFFVAYKKNFLILSKNQNGLSTLIKDKYHNLLEKKRSKILQISITKYSAIDEVRNLNFSFKLISTISFLLIFLL